MSLIVKPATPGLWFDCSTKLNAVTALGMARRGYVGVFRYLPLPPPNSPVGDIDSAEVIAITQAGLELSLVQHVRSPGWDPVKQSGTIDGGIAAHYATTAGVALGKHLFLDLEGVRVGATAAQCKIYCEAWAAEVIAHGYKAGLYVGYQIPMSPVDLYDLHGIDCYWSDFGHRLVATRGCAIIQKNPDILVGSLKVDEDEVKADLLGDLPWVTALDSAAQPNA
jgi:hypothetical protein